MSLAVHGIVSCSSSSLPYHIKLGEPVWTLIGAGGGQRPNVVAGWSQNVKAGTGYVVSRTLEEEKEAPSVTVLEDAN